MNHQPVYRPVEGASTAVLFIHGVCGTPGQFQSLLPLVPADWTVCNLLLDGHGKGPKDFAATSMAKWQAQVADTVDRLLAVHDRLLLVGHSMGTLLELQQALEKPDKLGGLFLLAVPMVCRVKPSVTWKCLLTFMGCTRPGSKVAAFLSHSSIRTQPWKLAYFGWLPRFFELMALGRRIRKQLLQVRVPCRCYQSGRDEVVSPRNLKLLQQHPDFTVHNLPNSDHFTHSPEDLEFLKAQFLEFIDEHKKR